MLNPFTSVMYKWSETYGNMLSEKYFEVFLNAVALVGFKKTPLDIFQILILTLNLLVAIMWPIQNGAKKLKNG